MRRSAIRSLSCFSALALVEACYGSARTDPPDAACVPATCAARGKSCGTIDDGCGHELRCGVCVSPQTCGADNVCGCTPASCAAQGKNCGTMPDGCGGTVSCGSCSGTDTCGGGGPNACGTRPCEKKTCAELGKECGLNSNNCDAPLDCGTCGEGRVCDDGRCVQPLLVVSRALALDKAAVRQGESLAATILWANPSAVPIAVTEVTLAVRPPGGTHSGGPFLNLVPTIPSATVQPGATLTLSASRLFVASDALGRWEGYSTYRDSNGAWHDGPSASFDVLAPSPDAGTEAPDAGLLPDGGPSHADAQVITGPDASVDPPDASLPPSACATEPLRTTGTIYYVCDCQSGAAPGCAAGSDSNSGTSPDAPWKSLGKTFSGGRITDDNDKAFSTFETMAAGSTLALCRGGSWTNVLGMYPFGSGTVQNQNCSAGAWTPLRANADPGLGASNPAVGTCDLRDYYPPRSTGSLPRPKIQLARVGDEYNEYGAAGVNLFAHLGWYQNYSQRQQGLRFLNLEIVGPNPAQEGAVAFQIYGSTTDVEMCNLDIHNGAKALDITTASTTQRIVLKDSYIHENYGSGSIGAVSGAAVDLVIDSNTFDHNGGDVASGRSHSVYFTQSSPERQCASGIPKVGAYCLIPRIKLTNNEIRRSAWGSGTGCSGAPLVVHDPFTDMVIENNYFHEPAGTAQGTCYGILLSNGGEAAYNPNVIIRRNRVFNVGWRAIQVDGAPDALIENNVIALTGTGQCIAYPAVAYDPATDLPSNNGKVRNNTCYLPDGTDGEACVMGIEEGTHVYSSNACQVGRGAAVFSIPSGSTDVANLGIVSNDATAWFAHASTDSAAADFTPKAGSALVGAADPATHSPQAIGTVIWTAMDPPKARVHSPTDVGAYER